MRTPHFMLALLALCSLFLATCSDDNPQSPSESVMKIYGTVTTPGEPQRRTGVMLESTDASFVVSTETNQAGEYVLDAPDGRYRLAIKIPGIHTMFHSAAGPTYRREDAEEIVAAKDHPDLRVDFTLGSIALAIHAPVGFGDPDGGCEVFDARTGARIEGWSGGWLQDGTQWTTPAAPGRYLLRIGSAHHQFWFPGVISRTDAQEVEVQSGLVASVTDSISAPAHVTGTILGPWAQIAAASRPEIRLFAPDATVTAKGACGEDGRFDVPILVDGEVRLAVVEDPHEIWLGGHRFADADPLTVTSGAIVDAGPIQTHGITCRLIGEPGWESDAWQAHMMAGEYGVTIDAVKGATAGEWILPLSGPIFSGLRVQWRDASEWRPQWYDRKASPDGATPLYVNDANGPTSIDIHLERGGTISGRVVDANGSPLPGAPMGARFQGTTFAEWGTADDGTFRIAGLPDGPVTIAVFDDRHTAKLYWYPGTLEESRAEPIEIVDADDHAGIEFVLPVPGD